MRGKRRQPIQVDPRKRKRGILVGGTGLLLFFIPAILMVFLPSEFMIYPLAVMMVGLVVLIVGYIMLRKAEAEVLEHVVQTRRK